MQRTKRQLSEAIKKFLDQDAAMVDAPCRPAFDLAVGLHQHGIDWLKATGLQADTPAM